MVTMDDDNLSVVSAQTADLTEPETGVCSTRQRARMAVSLFIGIVVGWCAIGVTALDANPRSEIRELCEGCELWELLVVLIAVNLICASVIVHTWYHHHFHHRKPHRHSSEVLGFVAVVQIAMTVWGATVLFGKCPSEHLKPFLVYTVVYVWIVWQLVLMILLTLFALCICVGLGGCSL